MVLQGGEGTLAELGFALAVDRPIFSVGSVAPLKKSFDEGITKLKCLLEEGLKIFPRIGGHAHTCETIVDRLLLYLAEAKDTVPVPESTTLENDDAADKWAQKLVRQATLKTDTKKLNESGFPEIELSGMLSKTDFENWLRRVPD